MKVFIQKVLVFSLLIILMSSAVIFLNNSLVRSTKFSFAKSKEILVLGDSNIKYAINDSIFNNAVNFSGEADSYFYSYLKLHKVLEDKAHNLKTVFISFSPHNIIDNGWLFNKEDIVTRFPKYYPLMEINDSFFLFKDNFDVLLSSIGRVYRELPNVFQSKIHGSIKSNYGGFKFVDSNNLDLVLDKLSKDEPIPHFNLPDNFRVSSQETLYLKKIITTCRKNNLKIILVNTPKRKELLIHKRYFVTDFNQYYKDKLKNIKYLDFSNVIMPDEYYDDLVHLNYRGATYFSNLIKNQSLTELLQNYKYNNQ